MNPENVAGIKGEATAADETWQLQSFQNSDYQRPGQKWLCGHECGPCAWGPSMQGDCQVATTCHPRRHRDSWICNRSQLQGGKCSDGPSADGQCCLQLTKCVPQLELRHRRQRFVIWCVAAIVGAGLLVLSSAWRNEVLAPGGLSEQHAQLLRDKNAARCAECHSAASQGLAGWSIAAMLPISSGEKTQSQLCMECHQETLPAETALMAHGLSASKLAALSRAAQERVGDSSAEIFPSERELACATCHREHHGAHFDLTAMTNQQCATCHQKSFVDFGDSHPSFQDWPYERRTRIAFDHVAHQAKYFPENQSEFACRSCHEQGGPTGIVSVTSFERACAACHDKKIEQSMQPGIPMLALPMLDLTALRRAGLNVGQWPARATGSFDGTLAPLMRLLLGSDRRAWSALQQFDTDFDLLDVDPESIDDLQAVHDIAWGIKQLIYDLVRDAQGTFRQRIQRSLRTPISDEQAEALSAQLSPALISGLQRTWFPALMKEVPAYRQNIGIPANGFEGQVVLDSRIAVGKLPLVTRLGSAGGTWHRDDRNYELVMQPKQHASAFLHSWLELLGRNTRSVLPENSWPLRQMLIADTGIGQCVSCHSIDQTGAHELLVNWHGDSSVAPSDPWFTKFAHQPHLLQPGFDSCTSCHVLNASQRVMSNYQGLDASQSASNFAPMSHVDCAKCHHSEGAGDSCLKCHEYHALSPTWVFPR